MTYTAVIRTLGTAGDKYQKLLDSLNKQTLQPERILVYIAEGYSLPKETIGKEEYIYVKKGMVAQRALSYREVASEYILFLDDDLFFPENFVEHMFFHLKSNNADIISPNIYPNAERSLIGKFMMAFSCRMFARRDDGVWAYKIMSNGGFSYNNNPKKDIYLSQTNAGACFFCRKDDFLKIHFEEELWVDKMRYALGEDQVMYYKMYCLGFKQLTWFNSGILHLDAGTTMGKDEKALIYSDFRFKTIFWHRFIYIPEKNYINKIGKTLCLSYTFIFSLIISLLKFRLDIFKAKYSAICEGISFIRSDTYKEMPKIKK